MNPAHTCGRASVHLSPVLTSPPALIPAGQGVHVEDLTTPYISQIYGVSIVIEYALSPSFATLVSPIITLAILYDAYYVTYMCNYVSIRSLFVISYIKRGLS